MDLPQMDASTSLRQLRRTGIALCSRAARERNLIDAAQKAAADVQLETQKAQQAATEEAEEAARKALEPQSTPEAPPSKKRKGDEAGSERKKSKLTKTEVRQEHASSLAASVVDGARVEVALQAEGLASWYNGLILSEKNFRYKLRMVMMDPIEGAAVEGETPETQEEKPVETELSIEGRSNPETVWAEAIRPVPTHPSTWVPSPNEICELKYLEGWWTVKVKRAVADKWEVVYEPYNNKHLVPRTQLRPRQEWDAAGRRFVKAGKP